MTSRRADFLLAAFLVELLLLTFALFLLWAYLRGFDPRFCSAYGGCDWRRA